MNDKFAAAQGDRMFSKVLDCPVCQHRFNFDHEGDNFPEQICCPNCQTSSVYSEFSAMTFCPQCRTKLKIPLDILFDDDLSCPSCGALLNNQESFEDTAASTITNNAADRRQFYKRMLKDGDIFDKYQIIRLLGKGGMAEVYLAEHLLLKQLCAVKLMRSNMGTDSDMAVKRFLREAKLSHQFDHPNIVKVFDVGSDFQTGYLFIAMEYVEGKTLHDLAKEQPFTEEQLNAVLVSMANALNELMAVRVVHRDIKPSNIMLTNDGVYKLMDLGIAKSESNSHMAGDMTLTLEQSTIGTPNYASPEQCRSAHNVDYRSDIYSLGATLYHLASGKLPFTGTTAVETILNVMQTEAMPLKSFRPDLSDKMIGLIEQMMRKNPAERPQLPDALIAAIYSSEPGPVKGILHKIGGGLKNMFAGKKQSENDKQPGRWKLIKSILRWTAAAALIVVILINFKHISNVYKKDRNLQEFVKGSDPEKQPPRNSVKKQDYFANKHPLMTFPDECGDLSKKMWFRKSQYIYPTVKFASDDESALELDYDFSESRYSEQQFESQLLQDGLADLSDQEYMKPVGNEKYKAYRRSTIPLGITVEDFTLSLDFCTNDSGDTPVFNIGSKLSAAVIMNRLVIFVSGSYYAKTSFTIPNKTWANITLIYDHSKRKLTLLSGDRLLGCYLLSYGFSWNNLSLGYSRLARIQVDGKAGKFDRIKVYNCARELVLPENDSAIERNLPVTGFRQEVADFKEQVAAKPVSTAANQPAAPATGKPAETPLADPRQEVADFKVQPEKSTPPVSPLNIGNIPQVPELENNRTVANRLAWCKKRLSILEKAEKFPFRQEMLDFVQKQISELTQQQKIVETVRAKLSETSRINSDTSQFINTAKKYLQAKKAHSSDRWKTEQALREQLNKGKLNVNAEFQEPSNNKSITVADFIYTHNILPKNGLAEFLREKFADVNKMSSLDKYSNANDIFFFGKEDIDSGEQPPIIGSMLKDIRSIYSYPEAGNNYAVELAGKALLLAPKIKDARDSQGRNLMHYAIMADAPEFAKKLIFAGFDQWHEKISGNISCWQFALRSGSVKIVELFRQIGMKDDAGAQEHLQFKLWQAAASRNYAEVENCLKNGADPYMLNGKQLNLLQYACSKNDADLVRLLLKLQVDPNKFNRYASSLYSPTHPLEIALLGCNAEILKLLYDAKARAFYPITQKVSLLLNIFNRRMYPGADKRLAEYTPEKVIEVFDILLQEKAISPAMLSRNIMMRMRSTFRMPKSERIKLCEYALKIAPERSLSAIYGHYVTPDLAGLVEKYSNKFISPISPSGPRHARRRHSSTDGQSRQNSQNSQNKQTVPDFSIRISVGIDQEFKLKVQNSYLELKSDKRSLSNYKELKKFRGFYSQTPECRIVINNRRRKWDFRHPFKFTENTGTWYITDVKILSSSREEISIHPHRRNNIVQSRDNLVWDFNSLQITDAGHGAGAYILEIQFSQRLLPTVPPAHISKHKLIR